MTRRPRNRGECINGPRPCPWWNCPHHLAPELPAVKRATRLRPTERELLEAAQAVMALPDTCALDVADRNPDGLDVPQLAALLEVTEGQILRIVRDVDRHRFAPLRDDHARDPRTSRMDGLMLSADRSGRRSGARGSFLPGDRGDRRSLSPGELMAIFSIPLEHVPEINASALPGDPIISPTYLRGAAGAPSPDPGAPAAPMRRNPFLASMMLACGLTVDDLNKYGPRSLTVVTNLGELAAATNLREESER